MNLVSHFNRRSHVPCSFLLPFRKLTLFFFLDTSLGLSAVPIPPVASVPYGHAARACFATLHSHPYGVPKSPYGDDVGGELVG
jgi:hypothetical protein